MTMVGKATMINWCYVEPENRAAFYHWHDGEHMLERVSVPGFQRGRRYIAVEGDLPFFNFYEVDSFAVLIGRDYNDRLNNPTPLTRKVALLVRKNVRALARIVLSLGTGQGGMMLTIRCDAQPGREDEFGRYLMHQALPPIPDMPEILGAHLVIADKEASTVVTEEKKGRDPIVVPNWMILVEGFTVEGLKAAAATLLSDEALTRHGGTGPYTRGVYQLQNTVSKQLAWSL